MALSELHCEVQQSLYHSTDGNFELKRSHEHKVIPTRIISITSLHFTPHYCVYLYMYVV